MPTTIRGIYRKGVIEPEKELNIKENTEVEIRIPKTLRGMGKQMVSDKELEEFLEEMKDSLAKV